MIWLAGNIESFVGEIADAGREAKTQQMTKSEDVVGKAGGIGRVFFDPQVGLMVEQTVEDVDRVANCGIDDLGMEGRVLIGDVRVESDSKLIAVFQIHLAGCFAAAAGAEALAV